MVHDMGKEDLEVGRSSRPEAGRRIPRSDELNLQADMLPS